MSSNQSEYSVYVGDLDESVRDTDIYQYFSQKYTSVLAANVIMDNQKKSSKGYGFVRFSD